MKRIKHERIGWHVIARGARRLELFRDDQDYGTYLSMLRFATVKAGVTLWGYTLMSNHYHLLLDASTTELTMCMMRVNRSYSRYHNRRYGLVGHAFDGPYKAFPQGSPLILLRTLAYIFMNPVAAGIHPAPEEYRWTCIRDYLALPGSPLRVDPSNLLSRVSKDPRTAWKLFHRALEQQARHPKPVVPDSLSRIQVHAQQFEWLLEHAKQSGRSNPSEDPVQLAVYWARSCGITPKAMAAILGLEHSQPIYDMIWQIKQRLKEDPSLAHRLALP